MSEPGRDRKPRRKLPILVESEGLELRTWVLMTRIYQRSVRRLGQVLEGYGLSLAQFEVMVVLQLGEGMAQQELAFRLQVTKGNICGLIDRMAANGWVERRPDADDRRVNRLYLTERGKALLAETIPPHHAMIHRWMSHLDGAEVQALYQLLDQLADGMGEESA